MRVFGLKKCTLVRIFFVFREMGVLTALATLDAFFAAVLPPSAAGPWRPSSS